MNYEQSLPETGSDYSAMAVRTRRSENHLSMAERFTAIDADRHRGRAGAEMLANGSESGQSKETEQNISRDRKSDGGAMGPSGNLKETLNVT